MSSDRVAAASNLPRDFLRACQSGDLRRVETLAEGRGIRDWSDFRHTSSGDTALHVAARTGRLDVVKYLCEYFDTPEFIVNISNKDMKRPLHEAAQFAQEDVLRYLLEKGVRSHLFFLLVDSLPIRNDRYSLLNAIASRYLVSLSRIYLCTSLANI